MVRRDFLAALVVVAITIPSSLGFAAIVGLPIQTGLYCSLLAPIIFALFTSSRHLVIGADSATAALVAGGTTAVAASGSPGFTGAVALLGMMTGILLLIMSLLRFGFLADLLSQPVLVGFMAGVGVQLIVSQLASMTGLAISGDVLTMLGSFAAHIGDTQWSTAAIGLGTLLLIFVFDKLRLPGALAALIIVTAVSALLGLADAGVQVVGAIPAGLPQLIIPPMSPMDMVLMFSSALAIAVVILAQSSAVSRSFASKYDEPVRDNKDLMALGFANIASALTQGFAVNGSPPRSLASEAAGGRSQMVNIFAALMIGMILLCATSALTMVPLAVLGAIICSIGFRLIDVRKLRSIWRVHKIEWAIAMLALVATALLGVQQGIMIAVLASLIERLRREYRPSDDILLRDGQIDQWAAERVQGSHRYTSHPDGVLVYHFDSDLFFENAAYFSQRINRAVAGAQEPVRSVILDAGAMSDIDYTGAMALKKLVETLADDDIQFGIAHVSPGLMRILVEYQVVELIGKEHIYASLREALRTQPGVKRSVLSMVRRLNVSTRSYVVIGGGVLEALGLRDTIDADLVVSKNTYATFRSKGWHEDVHDDGKRVLTHRGYRIMTSFMGRDLKRLQKHAFSIDGVRFMGLDDLIDSKEALNRAKDRKDITLIRAYQRRQRIGKSIAQTVARDVSAHGKGVY